MKIGFYHPNVGYWEATEYPTEEYRSAYAEGTVEIPAKPGPNSEWNGGEWVEVLPPQFNSLTHTLKKIMEQNGDTFSYRWDVLELPLDTASENLRRKRTALLNASDWIVPFHMERGEAVPQKWRDYRQALRDITTQAGFPYSAVWPEPPPQG